ncbi:MAG: PilZ domain-containing protein, partial [Deltaproteobacteria bacterium]
YFTKAWRPLFFLRRGRKPVDDFSGGLCIYTDEEPKRGARLGMEIFLPDGSSVVCRSEVAWVERLPAGGPARFDVGLKLTAIHPLDRERLSGVLQHA